MANEEIPLSAQEKLAMDRMSQWSQYEMKKDKTNHATLYIQYKGVWDMEGLLRAVIEFYTKEKFKYFERLQRHRHPGPFGVERLYSIEAHRNHDEYCRWNSSVILETFDEHDIDVVGKDGRKKKWQKGGSGSSSRGISKWITTKDGRGLGGASIFENS